MNILIGVYFNSEHGGLHDNIFSSVKAVLSNGGCATVLCKAGCFADSLLELGCSVIETNFSIFSFGKVVDLLEQLNDARPFDIVHAHPFQSREILHYFSKRNNIPFILTIHGQYDDELEKYHEDVDIILTVSEGIKDYVLKRVEGVSSEKIHVLYNAVNDVYAPPIFQSKKLNSSSKARVVTFVTRFDEDKRFILDVGLEAIKWASTSSEDHIFWQFLGDGTLLSEFKKDVNELIDEDSFAFKGWLSDSALAREYRKSDIVIGPGRCAIDALACGAPVIALGSKGYIGLIDGASWLNGVYSNFGGVGARFNSYEIGSIANDLDRFFKMNNGSKSFEKLGVAITDTFFNDVIISKKLISMYALTSLRREEPEKREKLSDRFWHPKHGLTGINLNFIDRLKLCVEIEHTRVSNYTFAWYEYENGNVIRTHNYTNSPVKVFEFDKRGIFAVRCFMKDKNGFKVSFLVVDINISLEGEKMKLQTKHEKMDVKLSSGKVKNKLRPSSLELDFLEFTGEKETKVKGLNFSN